MEELLTGIVKGLGLILRMALESGLWEFSLRKPGRVLLKVLWPPYWFGPVSYQGRGLELLGLLFWLVVGYLFFLISDRLLA
ncbi:MAG: hypothetical protein KDH88_07565 [Chromatiales bacterium]|nr:hypothetical protein [Chromatiales bacterium]